MKIADDFKAISQRMREISEPLRQQAPLEVVCDNCLGYGSIRLPHRRVYCPWCNGSGRRET